ncbi:histidine phosphatase family protein [Candidatus Rhabdochlamydia porcellionis]|jgi:broad specificity phosphatase PhoE|uniref:Acid phosphatase n=1 Tax=Candidatus Rhabdochlamydia porcellionis TaxID=225148 RepID=A0ABX8YZK2_9BACT|nr:histidine phosphatase family protein [Candidatus Rhabdochlamydia porcellionis]QZA58815.1 Acid phosphatase [Candidatus Rhabdochlamydia porcellionis]
MNDLYLVRHGQTKWSITGQHTSSTDLSLTTQGIKQAELLKKHLSKIPFELILTSPLKRSLETCELAGFSKVATIDVHLREWNYGLYEGWTKQQILTKSPQWNIFIDGAPNGESVADVKNRAQNILHKIQSTQGNVLIFSHGHFLRLFLTEWLQIPSNQANLFMLTTASISILSFNESSHVIKTWNNIYLQV